MKGVLKYILYFSLLVIVFNISEPFDPCTNVQNPQAYEDCNRTSTIYPNSVCCFLTSTKNDQTFKACFPSYYGSSRTYSANGISATFRCSGYFQGISILILFVFILNIINF